MSYDLKPLTIDLPSHATARVGDVFELTVQDSRTLRPRFVGCGASDSRSSCHGCARSAALVELALHLASQVLRPGGSVVVKVLEGRDMPQIVKSLRMAYQRVERVRPKATRRESTEIFLLGMGLVGMGRQESPNT
ncbi:MAG: SAM-dependent methyltransferase [Myxococcota bacterium]